MIIYKCRFCGYIYDSKKGDSQQDIPPSTSFDALPKKWLCPLCKMPKDMFDKEEIKT